MRGWGQPALLSSRLGTACATMQWNRHTHR